MLLGNPVLNWIGTRSYGLYLYHWPIFQIIRGNAGDRLTVPEFVVAMVFTCMITELSYRFVEMPIRRRQLGQVVGPGSGRRRPGAAGRCSPSKPSAVVAMFGFAAVSMATAPLKQNEVQAIARRGAREVTDVGAALQGSTTRRPRRVGGSEDVRAGRSRTRGADAAAPTTGRGGADDHAVGSSAATSPSATRSCSVRPAHSRRRDSPSTPPRAGSSAITCRRCVPSRTAAKFPRSSSSTSAPTGRIDEDDAREFFTLLADVPRVIVLTNWVERPWTESNNELIVPPEPSSRTSASASGPTWRRNAEGNCYARGRWLCTSAPTAPTTTQR